MTLGERIGSLRSQRGWSQNTLAEQLGVSRQSVSKWETNASVPDLDKLVRLSEVFQVTLDELVSGDTAADQAPSPQQRGTFGNLCRQVRSLYQKKAHLLGWLLAASGTWDLLRSAQILLSFQAALGEDSASRWFQLSLPHYLCAVLKILAGLLAVLWGRRVSGRFRWYHLGWALTAMGLFGVPQQLSFLKFGPLESLLTSLLLLRLYGSEGDWGVFSFWYENLDNLLLMVAGLLCIILGPRKAASTDHIS